MIDKSQFWVISLFSIVFSGPCFSIYKLCRYSIFISRINSPTQSRYEWWLSICHRWLPSSRLLKWDNLSVIIVFNHLQWKQFSLTCFVLWSKDSILVRKSKFYSNFLLTRSSLFKVALFFSRRAQWRPVVRFAAAAK